MRTSFSKGSRTSIVELTTEKVTVRGEEPVIVLDGKAKKLQLLKGSDVVHQSEDAEDRAVVRGNTVGLLWQTRDSAGNWVNRMELTGGVDVAELRTRKTVQKIIPSEAGADALVVRDTNDTEDRLKLREDGYIKGKGGLRLGVYIDASGKRWWHIPLLDNYAGLYFTGQPGTGLKFTPYAHFYCGGYGVLFLNYQGIRVEQPLRTYNIIFRGNDADDVNTLRNSLAAIFRGFYWDGSASVSRDFVIFHRMLSTTPESELALQLAGVDYLRIGDRGFRIEKNVFDAGSSVSVDAGATYTIPQGVYYVICGANTSVEIYDDVGATWVTLIPAGGVGIVVSDGSNARLYNAGTAAESSTLRRVF